MVNGVVFFAVCFRLTTLTQIGQSAIEAYLTAFQNADFDPLPIIASAFPTAAPYFASYVLLQTAIQPCFEVFRLGVSRLVAALTSYPQLSIGLEQSGATFHDSAFREPSSESRGLTTLTCSPTFSHFSQLPYQRKFMIPTPLTPVLAGAIMHLFMLLK